MSEYRQVRLDHEDIRNSLGNPDVADQPTATIGTITGSPGATVPAWFRVQPVRLGSATPAEDAVAPTENTGGPIWAYILGPEVPELGDFVSLRLIGGRWVGEFGGGIDVCHFQCGSHRFPKMDMDFEWSGPGISGTAILMNGNPFYGGDTTWGVTSFMTDGGYTYSASVSCYANSLQLTILKGVVDGEYIGQYTDSTPVVSTGPPMTIEWTVPAGQVIPEGTYTATADENGRCCGKFIVIGCVAEDTEVRAYDEDDVLMWTDNSVGGRISKMWNGTIKRIEVDSPDYRLESLDKSFPNGVACNSINYLSLPAIIGYICCWCDRPLPRRIYATTEDGTYPMDVRIPQPNILERCWYTGICYVKTVPNGVVLTSMGPPQYRCSASSIGTSQPTPVSIGVAVTKTHVVVSVSAWVWANAGFDGFCRTMCPCYFVSLPSCDSIPPCSNICGGLGNPLVTNPYKNTWVGSTAHTNCEVAVTVAIPSLGFTTPPISSVTISV